MAEAAFRPAAEAEGPEAGGDALVLPPALLRAIGSEMERAYPDEGCGVLLGRAGPGWRAVERVVAAPNRRTERRDRYLVDPALLQRLLEEEDAGGARVLGFYHSHPDHRPVPSETDRTHAWPWYHYLIVPTTRTGAGRPRAWELDPATGAFVERELRAGRGRDG